MIVFSFVSCVQTAESLHIGCACLALVRYVEKLSRSFSSVIEVPSNQHGNILNGHFYAKRVFATVIQLFRLHKPLSFDPRRSEIPSLSTRLVDDNDKNNNNNDNHHHPPLQ